jgi:hypothetical protein
MNIDDDRLKRLYQYWLDRKGDRRFPARRHLDPVTIRFVLGHVMLVDVLGPPLRFRVRLHGTEMARLAHYDLTGKFLDELPLVEYRDYVIRQCASLVENGVPLHVHHNRILDNRLRTYEALWLPFSEDDRNVTMLLCGLIYDPSPRLVAPPIEIADTLPVALPTAANPVAEPRSAVTKTSRARLRLGWSGLIGGWPMAVWAR